MDLGSMELREYVARRMWERGQREFDLHLHMRGIRRAGEAAGRPTWDTAHPLQRVQARKEARRALTALSEWLEGAR